MTTVDELVYKLKADSTEFSNGVNNAQNSLNAFSSRMANFSAQLQAAGQFGNTFLNVLDRMQITEMAIADAQSSLTSAQIRYNQTIEKFGENSDQAIIAAGELARAQHQVEKANMQANASMIMIGVTMLGQVPTIMNFTTTMVSQLKKVEIATLLTTARIKAMAPELLILSAVAGGVYYLWTTQVDAAKEATERFVASVSQGVSTATEQAQELKRTLEELKGITKSTEQRRNVREVEYQAEIAEIEASSLSIAEKKEKKAEAELQYNKDMLYIKKQEAEKALSLAKPEERKAILEEIKQISGDITYLELEGRPRREISLADRVKAAQEGTTSPTRPGREINIGPSSSLAAMLRDESRYLPGVLEQWGKPARLPKQYFMPEQLQGPSYGADRAEALNRNTQVLKETTDAISAAAKEPRTMNVTINANIQTYEKPRDVVASLGEGLRQGWDWTKVKI